MFLLMIHHSAFFIPVVLGSASSFMKPTKNININGEHLSTSVSINSQEKLLSSMFCSQIPNCINLYKNETGIYFLTKITQVSHGTGTLYWKNLANTFTSKFFSLYILVKKLLLF